MLSWMLLAMSLVGCDSAVRNPVDSTATGCPTGYAEPSEISVVVSRLQIEQVSFFATAYIAEDTWDDEPAACVSDDGTVLRLLISDIDAPILRVVVDAGADPDSYDLALQSVVTQSVEVVSADLEGSFDTEDWTAGTVTITETGSTLQFNSINVQGTNINEQLLLLSFSVTVVP